jgi:hypothetical protein
MPNIWPTIEFTAQDLVYNVLAVCHASIEDAKYSKKKNRNAGEKLSHILSNPWRLLSGETSALVEAKAL